MVNICRYFSQVNHGVGARACRSCGTQNRASTIVVNAMKAPRFFVGGNWKCNGTGSQIKQLVNDINKGKISSDVDVVCAPPYVYIPQVQASLNSNVQISAQNCWYTKGGAYTGEVSAEMLKDINVPWVILGHSERRSLCAEVNETVGDKVAYAQENGLSVIACIGETLPERESGDLFNVLGAQIQAIADKVIDWDSVVIAYEPVWAIGTGVVATPEQGQEVHGWLRQWIHDNVGADVADNIRIIYGGSVKGSNCVELAQQPDIDGFLVGGASLNGEEFVTICNASEQ